MAMTLSEDAYNDLRAKIDNYEYALRQIASWYEDEGFLMDPLETIASVGEIIGDLKAEGYLA